MNHDIWTSDSLEISTKETAQLVQFLQSVVNRYGFGHARYGSPDATKKYLSRLRAELKAYRREGNREQLLNIAVYCFLESFAPENKKYHFDPTRKSVTRD